MRAELLGVAGARPETTSLESYARQWLKRAGVRVKKDTGDRYAVATAHVIDGLGDYRLGLLRPGDVLDWQADQVACGFAPATINGWLRVLRSICRAASADFGIPDATAGVRALPEPRNPRRQGLTADQLRALLEHVKEHDQEKYPLLLVLALTGMRWGEATALRWEDLDEEAGELVVRRAHERGVLGPTKNGQPRTYPVVPELLEALRDHRRRLIVDQHPGLLGGWVFATRRKRDANTSALRAPSSWQKAWKAWSEALELGRPVTAHDLRRTWVDLSRQAGVHLLVARSLVGHASDAVHDRYSTVEKEEQRQAVAAVLRLATGGGHG